MTANCSAGQAAKLLILLAFIAVVWALLSPFLAQMAVQLGEHATQRHGAEAVIARECFGRSEMRMINPQTGRIANICLTSVGKYGIAIEENGREVTAFLKNKMTEIKQVIHYLENAGYILK